MPIQDVRQKLGRLLGKERSMREVDNRPVPSSSSSSTAAPSSTSTTSRPLSTKPNDSAPSVLSSPDTFDETKKRVSRMLLSPTRAISAPLSRSIDSANSTPSRGRRRVLLQSPKAITAPAKDSTPRKRISRSLSPLSTKPKFNKNKALLRYLEEDDDDDDFSTASFPAKQPMSRKSKSRETTPNRYDFPRIFSRSDEEEKESEGQTVQPQTRTIFIERQATPSSAAGVNTDESSFHTVKVPTLDPSYIKTSIQEEASGTTKSELKQVSKLEEKSVPNMEIYPTFDFQPSYGREGHYPTEQLYGNYIPSSTSSLAPIASMSNYPNIGENASVNMPAFDAHFCTEVIDEMMIWESSVETCRSWVDLNRKLKHAEKLLKRLGVDHIQYWKHNNGRLVKSDDQYQELPATFIDEILIPLCARHEVRQFALDEKDSNYTLFSKIAKIHDDFESKMLDEEDTLVHVLVQSNPNKGELVSEVLIASSASHRIRVPFVSFKGRHGEAFRSLINATVGLVLQKVSYAMHLALLRIEDYEKAQRIESNLMEESMKMSSKESLLALSLLLNSSDKLTLLFACAAVYKTASIFNNHAWLIFLETDSSSIESMTSPTVLKFISPNDQRVFRREIVMPRVPLLQLFVTDQLMQTQTLQVTEASQMAWLGMNGYKLSGEESISVTRTVFKIPSEHASEESSSNRYCVILSTVSSEIKKSIQVSHCRDLSIITQTSIVRMIERQRFASKLNLSTSLNQLVHNWKLAETHQESDANGSSVSQHLTLHRELRHLANTIHTNTFHESLGVKSAKLLFSSQLAQGMGLIAPHPDEDQNNGYFYQSNGTSWIRYNHKPIPSSDIPWLDDLYDGKVVLFNPGYESHLMLKGHGHNSSMNTLDVSRVELMRFLSYLDDDIWSSILFPINTSQGVAVLVLSNKIDDLVSTELSQHSTGVDTQYAFFTAQYVDAIHSIQLLTHIGNVLEMHVERRQRVSHLSAQSEQSEDLVDENRLLLAMIPKLRANQLKTQSFHVWKALAMERKAEAALKKKEFMLNYSTSLISCRHQQCWNKPKDVFLDVVKQFIQTLFVHDRVEIHLHDEHERNHNHDTDNISLLSETIVDTFDEDLFKDLCRGVPNSYSLPSATNLKRQPVAHVIITRSSSNTFTSEEMEMLEDIIQHTSDVYSSLRLGMQEVTVEGDVNRWLLVMLQDVLLPMLSLDRGNSCPLDQKNRLLRMVTQTVRKLVAADVVILHSPSFNSFNQSGSDEIITMSSANPVEEKKDESIWKKFLQDQDLYDVDFSTMDASGSGSLSHPNNTSSPKSTVIEGRVSHRYFPTSKSSNPAGHCEMKLRLVLGKDKEFTEEHKQVVESVLKMLQHHFYSQQMMKEHFAQEVTLKDEIQQSSLHLKKYTEDFETLELQNQFHSLESSFMNQLFALFTQINTAQDPKQFIMRLAKSVPIVFPCAKVALVISDAIHFDVSPVMVENFTTWLPSYEWMDEAESKETALLFDSLPRSYTLHQLMQLPLFFALHASSSITSIPLYFPYSKRLLGSVLLLRDSKYKAVDIPKHFQQFTHLAEVISKLLSFSTYSIFRSKEMNKLVETHQEMITTLQNELQKKEHALEGWKVLEKEKRLLEEEVIRLQQSQRSSVSKLEDELAEKDDDIQQKIEAIQLLQQQLEETEISHTQQVQSLTINVENCTDKIKDCQVITSHLVELTTKFALDQRCKPDSILVWLKEIAEMRQSTFAPFSYTVQQESSRVSSSNNAGLQGVHGLWSAVGEAIRTNKSVCFMTTRSTDNESDVDTSRWLSTANKATTALATSRLMQSPHALTHPIEVLCIPNRAIISTEDHSEYASCFVFIKPKSEKWHVGFTEEDKLMLEIAVNVSSRMLVKTVVEVNTQLMHKLEVQIREKSKIMERILTCLQIARGMLTADIKSSRELGELLQQDVIQALTLPQYHDIQLDCQFIPYTSISQGSKRSASQHQMKFSPKLQELIMEAKTRSHAVRNGSSLLVPLILADGKCHGIILVEKKLKESHSSGSKKLGLLSQLTDSSEEGNPEHNGSEIEMTQDLLISDVDFDMVNIFASFAAFILEKLEGMKDAVSSLQEASQAIMAIQDSKAMVEERLSAEIAIKLEYEEALRKSSDIITTASSQRSTMGQLLESLRKSTLSLTSADHCYVILPYAAEQITTEILLEQNHQDFGSALSGDSSNLGTPAHYTLLPDSPFPIPVRLESGDIEQIALQHYRSIFLPSQTDFSDFQGLQLNKSSTMCWRSWVIRRIEGNRLLGKRIEEGQLNENDPPYYAMMIPFYIRANTTDSIQAHVMANGSITQNTAVESSSQGKVALMVVIRQSTAFTECNRECVAWLCQALSFSLATRGGEYLAKMNLTQLRALQEDFKTMQAIQHHYDALADDSKQLMKFLDNGLASDDHPSVLKHLEASVKTFSKHLISKQLGDGHHNATLVDEKAMLEQYEESTFLRAIGLLFERVQYSFATDGLQSNTSFRRKLVIEPSTEKQWSDFVVETTSNSGGNSENILEPGEDLIRYGCFNAKGKFTIKFGYLTIRERAKNVHQGKSSIFLRSHSGIMYAMIRLELLERGSIQYFLVKCDHIPSVTSHEEDEDILPASSTECNVGFCLINLDLKVRLVERLCETYFTWSKELLHYAHLLQKHRIKSEQETKQHQQVIEEQMQSLHQIRVKCQEEVVHEKESFQQQLQRVQRKIKTLDQMNLEASNIPMYLQSLPDQDLLQGSIQVLMSWIERFAKSAQVDFAMGYSRVADTNLDNHMDIVDTMKTIEWVRNERNLEFYPAYSPHSSHNVKKYQVTTVLPKDCQILHSKSHTWQQILLDVHQRFSTAFPVILDPINIVDEESIKSSQAHKIPSPGSIVLFFPQILRSFEHEGKLIDCKCLPFVFFTPKAPISGEATPETGISGSWLRYLVSTLYTLAIHTAQRKVLAKVTSQVKIHRGLHAITKLQFAQQKGLWHQLLKEFSFQSMKATVLLPRLQQQNADLRDSVLQSKKKIQRLDSIVADWTELAKGVNGACYHVKSGVATLWGRVCSTLMTMLASRCKVQGCGIVLPNQHSNAASSSSKMYEYVVRDITTPHPRRGGDAFAIQTGDEEYSKGALERRSTLELGNKLNAQLLDIFESNGGVQRVYKTTLAPRDHDMSTESLAYLIPVKTAHEVIAVLRVSIDSLSSSDTYGTELLSSSSHAPQDITAMIESNLVNFAELLAPVLVSAQSIESQSEQNQDSQQMIQSMKSKLQTVQDQVVDFMMETQVMKAIIPKAQKITKDILYRFFQQITKPSEVMMEEIDNQTLALESSTELIRQLSTLLREGCRCDVDLVIQSNALSISATKVNRDVKAATALAPSINKSEEDSDSSYLESGPDRNKDISGSKASGKHKREFMILDLQEPSEIIGTLTIFIKETETDRFGHTSSLTTLVFQPLCHLLSHFVLTITSSLRHQRILELESTKYINMKGCYDEMKENYEDAQQVISELTVDVSIQQQWTKATSTCLDFITNYSPSTSSNNLIGAGPTGNHVYAILPPTIQEQIYQHGIAYSLTALSHQQGQVSNRINESLYTLIHFLLIQAMTLLAKQQQEEESINHMPSNSSVGLSVSILDRGGGEYQEESVSKKLIWIHGGSRGITHSPNFLLWSDLSEQNQQIIINVTNLSISTKETTEIEIKQALAHSDFVPTTVQVKVVPLFNTYTEKREVIGALQILMLNPANHILQELGQLATNAKASSNSTKMPRDGANQPTSQSMIVLDVIALLSRMVSYEVLSIIMSQYLLTQESQLVSTQLSLQQSQERLEDVSADSRMQQKVQRVCMMLLSQFKTQLPQLHQRIAGIEEGSTTRFTVLDVLQLDNIRPLLQECSMMLKIVNVPTHNAMSTILEEEVSHLTLAKSIIPLYISGIDSQSKPADKKKKSASNSSDAVNKVGSDKDRDVLYIEISYLASSAEMALGQSHRGNTIQHMNGKAYEYVDQVTTTIQSIIQMYSLVQEQAFSQLHLSQHSEEETKQLRQHLKKLIQDNEQWKLLLQHQEEESKRIEHVSLLTRQDIAQQYFRLYHGMAIILKEAQHSLMEILRNASMASLAANASPMQMLEAFLRQSIKTWRYSIDQVALTASSSPKFVCHTSVIIRKDSIQNVLKHAFDLDDDDQKENQRQSKSKSKPAIDTQDMMKVLVVDSNGMNHGGAHGEYNLIRDARRSKAIPTNSLSSFIPSLLEPFFFPPMSSASSATPRVYVEEIVSELSPTDLIGLEDPVYHVRHQKNANTDQQNKYLLILVGIKLPSSIGNTSNVSFMNQDQSSSCDAVIRFVCTHPEVFHVNAQSATTTYKTNEELVKNLEEVALFNHLLLHNLWPNFVNIVRFGVQSWSIQQHTFGPPVPEAEQPSLIETKDTTNLQMHSWHQQSKQQLSKYRTLYKSVLREACMILLDPPNAEGRAEAVTGPAVPRSLHPAALTPLAASQDSCGKILSVVRTILKSEGQAILLKDTSTVPYTYQVLYTGDALTWPGVEQGSFGVITAYSSKKAPSRPSLVESVVNGRKSIVVENAPLDERYVSHVDGICSLGTPMMAIPLRGRGGSIVGSIMIARSKNGPAFVAEDVMAAEMISSMGSLSLYWCQGLTTLHHTLHKTLHKVDKLEKAMGMKSKEHK